VALTPDGFSSGTFLINDVLSLLRYLTPETLVKTVKVQEALLEFAAWLFFLFQSQLFPLTKASFLLR